MIAEDILRILRYATLAEPLHWQQVDKQMIAEDIRQILRYAEPEETSRWPQPENFNVYFHELFPHDEYKDRDALYAQGKRDFLPVPKDISKESFTQMQLKLEDIAAGRSAKGS